MTCVVLFWILTHFLLAWLGMKVAELYVQPWALGAVIGLVFHLPGVLVLWALLAIVDPPKSE